MNSEDKNRLEFCSSGIEMTEVLLIIVGLASLVGGGDLLLRGAVSVATAFGMSRFLIGLTIVSLGTSAPEMAICVDAALGSNPEIALGNIIGSNVANVLLILGLTALVMPVVVPRKIIQIEVPIMIGVSLLFVLVAIDGFLSPIDGGILLASMLGFLAWQFWAAGNVSGNGEGEFETSQSEIENETNEAATANKPTSLVVSAVLIFAGAALLWLGAGWLVQGASGVAVRLGISQMVIGLTIVAIGSSAPEIVTSILAARRGYPEMSLAGVIGSNIANLLLVGGMTAVLSSSIPIPSGALQFELPVMVVCAIVCLPIFTTGHRIARWEGVLFLFSYIAFTLFLFYRPMITTMFPNWSHLVWPIVAPLIIATFIAVICGWRSNKGKRES